jgi:hypothetical protein
VSEIVLPYREPCSRCGRDTGKAHYWDPQRRRCVIDHGRGPSVLLAVAAWAVAFLLFAVAVYALVFHGRVEHEAEQRWLNSGGGIAFLVVPTLIAILVRLAVVRRRDRRRAGLEKVWDASL